MTSFKSIKNIAITIFALIIVLSPINQAEAVFLLLQEISGEATGQAGMLTAAGGRPSSQYHNASNLSFIDDFNIEAALSIYIPKAKYTNPEGQSTSVKTSLKYAPHLFASFKANEWLTFGLACFPNFGIIIDWPDNWEGKHEVIYNSVKSFTINPNVSFGPFKGFAIAVGISTTWSYIKTSRVYTVGYPAKGQEDSKNLMTMIGDGWSIGANAGMSYQPAKWVRLGLSYRSSFTLNFDGVMDFEMDEAWAWRFPDQDFSLKIKTPHQVSFGSRFWPIEELSIELDVWYFSWSVHKARVIKLSEGVIEGPDRSRMEDYAAQNLKDGVQVGVGLEYWFLKNYVLRAGMSFSSNVLPDEAVDPIQPDGHRLNSAMGFGVQFNGFYADVAYLLGYIIPHTVGSDSRMPGKYEMLKHVATLSVGYSFDPFAKSKKQTEQNIAD